MYSGELLTLLMSEPQRTDANMLCRKRIEVPQFYGYVFLNPPRVMEGPFSSPSV